MSSSRTESPSRSQLKSAISEARGRGKVTVLFTDCTLRFEGQREGEIGRGERIVICKPDGSIAVHRPTRCRAIARQGIGSSLEFVDNDDFLRLYAAKGSNERLRVDLYEVHELLQYDARDDAELEETGTEDELHEYISANPSAIEEGLRILGHEHRTPNGFIDFFARDADGNAVVIEIKQPAGKLAHVDQLRRYVSHFKRGEAETWTVRGILVAPEIGKMAKRTLRDHDLEGVELPKFSRPEPSSSATTLDEF